MCTTPGDSLTARICPLCDEFPGRRGSDLVIPVASGLTMDRARGSASRPAGGS
jgi:hypothetical protein